jgi:predicted transcriptional regulator
VDLVDQRLQTMPELHGVHVPVAQAGAVVGSLTEPTVVDDKALDTDACGLLGQRLLPASSTLKPVASQEL